MKKEYYRIVTLESRDLNPVRSKDLLYFDSGDYQKDVKRAKEFRPKFKFIYLTRRKYDTFGDIIK